MMRYIIKTGQFEKGTQKQQAAFIQLFGAKNVQYQFDLYFHWYNIAHEYGHCLCNYHESDIIGLKQEFLVNRFAVGIWKYAGYEKELKSLQKMLSEILQNIKCPVPDHMSFTEYYESIWGTDQITQVPIYGYFQFKSVLMALEGGYELAAVFKEMGIHNDINHGRCPYKEYFVSAETAKEVLNDLQHLLNNMGIEQPVVDMILVDDPTIQCGGLFDE